MLFKPTHEGVFDVASRMRDADKREIYSLHWIETPFVLVERVMAAPQFAWISARDGRAIACFGAAEVRPGTWAAYCFATDEFPKTALEVTRFLVNKVKPHLFKERGAWRIEADSHFQHFHAHRWLQRLGARQEGPPMQGYNKHGEPYIKFVMTRGDFVRENNSTKDDNPG